MTGPGRAAVLALLGLTACDVPDRLRELFTDAEPPDRTRTPDPPSPEINAPAYGIPETAPSPATAPDTDEPDARDGPGGRPPMPAPAYGAPGTQRPAPGGPTVP